MHMVHPSIHHYCRFIVTYIQGGQRRRFQRTGRSVFLDHRTLETRKRILDLKQNVTRAFTRMRSSRLVGTVGVFTHVKLFRVFFAIGFRDALVLYGFENPWHGRDQRQRDARMSV